MTVKPTKEYFRKPYLVDDKADAEESEYSDYRYMMDTDWQGLQDSSYIVVQSVRKKPYAEDDYQEMEQKANGYTGIDWYLNWNWYRPKFNWGATFSPIEPEYQPATQTRTLTGKLSWIQCPTTVGLSMSYTIIVKNSYSSKRVYSGGMVQSNQVTYSPSSTYLEKKSANAKGLTITRVWQRNSATYAILETSSTATGTYYIYAADGKNTIEKALVVSNPVVFGISATIGATNYWLTFDKNLNYLGVVGLTNYSESAKVDEAIYDYYNDAGSPTITTGIKKGGSYVVGPYSCADDYSSGEIIAAPLAPSYQGSVNGHSLIRYSYQNYDTSDYKSYVLINDSPILILDDSIGGNIMGGGTYAYSDYACLITISTTLPQYKLWVMDADGNYKTLDWTSGYRFDSESGLSYATVDGVEFGVATVLKRIH